MPTNLAASSPAAPAQSEPTVRSAQQEQARAQAKQLKKQRKAERLRFFFGWCEGCRAFGNSF